jgi:hypothetical protein
MPLRIVRLRRKSKGLCTVCGKRPLTTISYCQECRIFENNYKKRRWRLKYEVARSQGKCTKCFHSPARVSMVTCMECNQNDRLRRNELKARGKCLSCSQIKDDPSIHCIRCKKQYDKAKSEAKCISCNNHAKPGKVRCEHCTQKALRRGAIIGWINKFNLYLEMGGKCMMCGNTDLRVLVIDHVQYYNHHAGENGRVWNKLMLQVR